MFFQLVWVWSMLLRGDAAAAPVGSVPVTIINNAGYPIELYWVDTFSRNSLIDPPLVAQTEKPIRNGSETTINSYNTHTFRVKFARDHPSKAFTEFSKGPKEEIVKITFDGKELVARRHTRFDEFVGDFKTGMERCGRPGKDGYHECLVSSIFGKTQDIMDQTSEIRKYRDLMSERLRNYTCADPNMTTTKSINTVPISFQKQLYTLEVLLDTSHAKIWYVKNFISPEECAVLTKHGQPRLTRATVAAADGSSVVSENRKAQQASYNLHQTKSTDPLKPLYDRILFITNKHAGYSLEPDGQEDFTIIQYNADDEYTPHCDGACEAEEHTSGGRIATAVMYCEVPKRGGATTFTKADIFVKPEPGMATFFSYLGPDNRMDHGLTEHSGCPVLEGQKWITTAWMRKGVSKAQPWTMFTPSGELQLEPDEHQE